MEEDIWVNPNQQANEESALESDDDVEIQPKHELKRSNKEIPKKEYRREKMDGQDYTRKKIL